MDLRGPAGAVFRLDLYHRDDPEVVASTRVIDETVFGAMRTMLGPADEERVRVAGIAAWSLVHGLATLILSGNLPEEMAADPESLTRAVGGAAFGRARQNELASTTPGLTMAGSPSPPGGPATLSQDRTSR